MEAKRGRVIKVSSKDWYDSRKGQNITLHSFQIDSDRNWFRTGTKKEVSEGNVVEFVVGPNSAAKDIRQVADAPAAAPAPARSSGGGSRDDYWSQKEQRDLQKDERYQTVDVPRMVYQASQERAIALLALAHSTEAISLPAKKGDRLDALILLVDEVAQQLAARALEAHTILGEQKAARPTAARAAGDEDFGDEE